MAVSMIKQPLMAYKAKSEVFPLANNASRAITCENALIVSVKNSSGDTINGSVVFVSNLGGSLKINKVQNAALIEVSYSNGVVTITNKAGMYQVFMVFYNGY